MQLISIKYEELVGQQNEWRLQDMSLENINLVVGRNASGKSRSINIIWAISTRLSGLVKEPLAHGSFELKFRAENNSIDYSLSINDGKIKFEEYKVNGVARLSRGEGGSGKIYAEQEGRDLAFQAPEDQLAVVVRQDKLQHSFLENLLSWSRGVYYIPFGTSLGRDHLAIFLDGAPEVNVRDANQVTAIYRKAEKKYGDEFKFNVIKDMARIGYDLEDVGITFTDVVKISAGGKLSCLYVKERDLPAQVEQFTISQGMFRALSTIIQINFGLLDKSSRLVLIDDIGEGLDYSRSCELINLVISRIKDTSIQLIASTNDRFVMNGVSLKYWTILDRRSNTVWPLNYRNSKEVFDDFRFTGLSNFDFLSRDFFKDAVK